MMPAVCVIAPLADSAIGPGDAYRLPPSRMSPAVALSVMLPRCCR